MAGNRIASLFAELGFVINRAGLKQFQSELKATANQINSQQGITGATGRAQKTTNKFFADMQKNYSKMRPNLDQMKKDLDEVRKSIAGGLSKGEMRQAVDLQERISRDIGKEYEKLAKQKARTEKQASDAVNRNIKQRQAMYQREQKGIERAERSKRTAMERTRNKLIQVTRRYSSHDAKLMQIRDSVRAVNQARREERISLERAQQEVRQLTYEYRRLQAAQNTARAGGPRIGAAGGIYADGRDPRQVGNHRFISALHSDIGLGAMFGGYAIARSTRSYQEYLAMEQGIGAATGSMEQAKEEMQYLRDLSNEMGLFMGDLGSDYAKFAASARGTSLTIEQQRDVFKGVAAQVRILNLSAADSQRIFRALSQMMSSGQIMAQELKLQMGDQLPGAMRAMARAAHRLGITQDDSIASMNEAMSQGKLMSEEILPVFADELWQAANQGGALQEAMQNTGSAIGRFSTNFWYANKVFQEAGMDRGIRNLMNTMSDFIVRSDNLWRFFGQLGETLADSLRGIFELFGTLGENFKVFENLASSLGLEMGELAGVLAMFFKRGRLILYLFWLLPAAISNVSKLIDGEKLAWEEWAIVIAAAAGSLKLVYDRYKKIKGLGGESARTGGGTSPEGSAGTRRRMPRVFSKWGLAAVVATWLGKKGYDAFAEWNHKKNVGAPLVLKPEWRDGSAISSQEPLIFKPKSESDEESLFMTGTLTERLGYRLNEITDLFSRFRDYLSDNSPTPTAEALRFQGMGENMPSSFGPAGVFNSNNVHIDRIDIVVDGANESSDTIADRVLDRFNSIIRDASLGDPISEK